MTMRAYVSKHRRSVGWCVISGGLLLFGEAVREAAAYTDRISQTGAATWVTGCAGFGTLSLAILAGAVPLLAGVRLLLEAEVKP